MYVIIPAGGMSIRFGTPQKKQFITLLDLSVLEHSIQAFSSLDSVEKIIVALPEDELSGFKSTEQVIYVEGGKTRAESVNKAFLALGELPDDTAVLIHDAARPLVSKDLINRIEFSVNESRAVIPALPVTDTIKEVDDDDWVKSTIPREKLRAVQTPQGFRFGDLNNAYATLDFRDSIYTDESMLIEASGVRVKVIDGESTNLKITTNHDLQIAELLMSQG